MTVEAGELLQLLAARDRLDARITAQVGHFDATEGWDLDAATSMRAWLRDRARMTNADAGRPVTLARRTRALPVTTGAWRALVLTGRPHPPRQPRGAVPKHHKRLHQPGWHAKLLPDATLEATNPQSLVRTSHPPGTLQPFR